MSGLADIGYQTSIIDQNGSKNYDRNFVGYDGGTLSNGSGTMKKLKAAVGGSDYNALKKTSSVITDLAGNPLSLDGFRNVKKGQPNSLHLKIELPRRSAQVCFLLPVVLPTSVSHKKSSIFTVYYTIPAPVSQAIVCRAFLRFCLALCAFFFAFAGKTPRSPRRLASAGGLSERIGRI